MRSRRRISGLIRTEKDPHCIIPADPRGTGCLNLTSAHLLFSQVILLVMNKDTSFDLGGRRSSGTESSVALLFPWNSFLRQSLKYLRVSLIESFFFVAMW